MSALPSWRVYAVFFVSGASALVYQVLWSRWLGLVFGNTTVSVSIVLASFMGGLALGSRFATRWLERTQRPLRAYALVEVGIGAFAVAFPATSWLVEGLFTTVVTPDTPTSLSLLVRAVLAFALLLVPTALMGATLPLLTEFFRRNPRASSGWKVGVLYTANTLGAAAGVLGTSLLLIELLGVFATTLLAALMNFAVASVAWRFGSDAQPSTNAPAAHGASTVPVGARIAFPLLTLTGALALAGEVLWTRAMETLMGTSTYAFSFIVFVFLVGIAAGSWAMSLWVTRISDKAAALAGLVTLMALWMLAGIFLFRYLTTNLGAEPGSAAPLSTIFFIYFKVVLLLAPLALASGACFPLATFILTPKGDEAGGALVGRAYAWNTVGSVLGALVAGFVIAPRFDFLPALFVIAVGYAVAGTACALFLALRSGGHAEARRVPRWALVCAGFASCAAVLFAFASDTPYAPRRIGGVDVEVAHHRAGTQAVTTVVRVPGEPLARWLLVNGMGMTVKATDTKMMAHLPLAHHKDPQDTLVVCFGMGTTYRSALSHGGNVTVVELVDGVFDAFPWFYEDANAVLANPRGKRIVNDGRNFLLMSNQRFDVITIDPPPPIDGAGVNNLYSRDFIALARERLKEGGILAHWVPFVGTDSGVDDQRTFQMIVDTFAGSFDYVYAIAGYHRIGLHLLGSMQPIEPSQARIEALLANPAIGKDIQEFDVVTEAAFQPLARVRPPDADALVLTDDQPLLEYYFLRTALAGGTKMVPNHVW